MDVERSSHRILRGRRARRANGLPATTARGLTPRSRVSVCLTNNRASPMLTNARSARVACAKRVLPRLQRRRPIAQRVEPNLGGVSPSFVHARLSRDASSGAPRQPQMGRRGAGAPAANGGCRGAEGRPFPTLQDVSGGQHTENLPVSRKTGVIGWESRNLAGRRRCAGGTTRRPFGSVRFNPCQMNSRRSKRSRSCSSSTSRRSAT